MKIFIKKYFNGAGKWIYDAYFNAWKELGYDATYYSELSEITPESDYFLMCTDSDLNDKKSLEISLSSKKTFLYVQPNTFPYPWGTHQNFVSLLNKNVIPSLKKDNIIKWTFSNIKYSYEFFKDWGTVHYIPLAFDDILYTDNAREKTMNTDLAYVGTWANNGFDEKKQRMIKIFSFIKQNNLQGKIFINKKISTEQEYEVLRDCKACLNIHDTYQKKLGFDCNERTFKSLGINGLLLSDDIKEVKNIFGDRVLYYDDNVESFLAAYKKILSMKEEEILSIRSENIDFILKKHTYKNRIESFLQL